jgi:prepilin-type N-terminal cleavage/methylation domain-containing protein
MKQYTKGFTLIELLIVVAIIAILAAIAVPNFLEAQTRSKVAKVYADFRTTATAVEAFRVDTGEYPPSHGQPLGVPGRVLGTDPAPPGATDFIETPDNRFNALTSPVAYMTRALASSPFKAPGEGDAWYNYYQYSTLKGLLQWNRFGGRTGEGNAQINGFYRMSGGQKANPAAWPQLYLDGPAWQILDRGPDQLYFYVWANPGWLNLTFPAQNFDDTVVWYDPTNGTISEGEISRSQSKSSFQ